MNLIGRQIENRESKSGYKWLLAIIVLFIAFPKVTFSKDYLQKLTNKKEYESFQTRPLVLKYGNVAAVKVVYNLNDSNLFFVNSNRFYYHYNFCESVDGWNKGLLKFNKYCYSENPNQTYLLANLNYFENTDQYVLEFSALNQIGEKQIEFLYNKIQESSFFGKSLLLLNNCGRVNGMRERFERIKFIEANDLYLQQEYQPICKTKGVGFLRRVKAEHVQDMDLNHLDILVVDGSSNYIPSVSGVITTEIQNPLSHISLLGINRKIPICSFKNAWDSKEILKYVDKPVELIVGQDSFLLRVVDSALVYECNRAVKTPRLRKNLKVKKLLSLDKLSFYSKDVVGGKAANYAELLSIDFQSNAKVSRNAFAIPFSYYAEHARSCGAQVLIDSLIAHCVEMDKWQKELALQSIRKKIKSAGANRVFVKEVEAKVLSMFQRNKVRFRSSTNSEDIAGFNGAGLYDSKSAQIGNKKKTVEKAVKKVWASLWNYRAFEERQRFKINQADVAMGILVHAAFVGEEANGVALTKNLYRKSYSGFTISVQMGEESVVSPKQGVYCDHFITFDDKVFASKNAGHLTEWIAKSNRSNGKQVLTNPEIKNLAKALTEIKKHFFELAIRGGGRVYNNFALDVEFKFSKYTRQLYIKQAGIL